MRSKVARSVVSPARAATSRREFLQYGAVAAGSSLLAPLWPPIAAAATVTTFDYYISPTGADTNAGTLAAPWAITALRNNAATYAGKRVGIIAGYYPVMTIAGLTSYSSVGDWSTPYLLLRGGTASSPTYIASCDASGNYQPRVARLDAQANYTNNSASVPLIGVVGGSYCNYITLDGLEIMNGYSRLVTFGSDTIGFGVATTHALGIVVKNCYVHDISNQASGTNPTHITIWSAQGALVQNNYVTGCVDTSNRGDGIEFWNNIGSVCEYNTVIGTSTMAGAVFFKNQGNYNNTLRYNYFDLTASGHLSQGGFTFDEGSTGGAGTQDSAYNNIIIADQPVFNYDISTPGFPNTLQTQNWYNNTLVGTPGFTYFAFFRNGGAGTIKFYNNIVSGSGGNYGQIMTNLSAMALTDYNLISSPASFRLYPDGSSATSGGTSYSSIASWAAALPAGCIGKEAHTILGSPVFAGGSPQTPAPKYQLGSGSPGKAAGSSTGQAGGTAIDMGAWGGTDVSLYAGQPIQQIGASFTPVAPNPPVLTVS